jgi:hypothetical protein
MQQIGLQGVAVLFQESADIVRHVAGVVLDDERAAEAFWPLNGLVVLKLGGHLVEEGLIGRLGEATLLVQQGKEARRRSLFDRTDALGVVAVLDTSPVDLLSAVSEGRTSTREKRGGE